MTKKISLSPFLPFSLSLLHLAIALPLAYILNIWADEASTLYTTEHGIFQTFQRVFADEKQAPLYFLLLSIWRELSSSVFFARVLSVIFSLLAIKFFYDLARKFFDEKAAVFVTAFFALHPFLIWASLEIRVYSLVVLLSVLLLKFFTDGYLEAHAEAQSSPKRAQIFYILISIAALYTNYYLGFLLAGNFAALVVLQKRRAAKKYFLQMIIVSCAVLPLLAMIKMQFDANTGGFQGEKSLGEGLRLLWNHFLTFVLPTELFTPERQTWISFVRVWLMRFAILTVVILFARRFYKIFRPRKPDKDGAIHFSIFDFDAKVLLFGAIFAVVGAFLLAAYFLLGVIYMEIRHAAVWFAPCVLLVFTVLLNIVPRRSWIVFALLFAGLFSYSIYTLYPEGAKRGDWARVGEYIQSREKPNQPIIVFTVFESLGLPYHYRGVNRILPDERFFNWGTEAEFGTADSLKSEIAFTISEIPPDAEEIWLATGEICQTTKACEPLENFLRANYTIVEEKDFYKEKIRLLRKKQK